MVPVGDDAPLSADFAVRISGDSMEPYILDGSVVYVKAVDDLSVGDVGIFCVNGEMYCKQYDIDSEGNLHLWSANPKRSDLSVHVARDSGASVSCCGKVILDYSLPIPDYATL